MKPIISLRLALLSFSSALVFLISIELHSNAHPHARPDSFGHLDQVTYIRHMAVRAHLGGDNRRWKLQMMSIGERDAILFRGDVRKATLSRSQVR